MIKLHELVGAELNIGQLRQAKKILRRSLSDELALDSAEVDHE